MAATSDITIGVEPSEKERNPAGGKGRRDKSRDVMTTFEARLDKVERVVADGQEKFEELGQGIAGLEGEGAELRGEMQATLNLVVDDLRKYIDSKFDLVHAEIAAIREEMKEMKGDVSLCKAAAAQAKVDSAKATKKGRMYVEAKVCGSSTCALVDTGASHNFIEIKEAERLGLKFKEGQGWLKAVNSEARPIYGVARDVWLHIGNWSGKVDFSVVPMDDYPIVLGMEFLDGRAMAYICPAMAQFSRQWLRFLGNGQPWPRFLGSAQPWLKFVGNGTQFLGNGQPWPNILGSGTQFLGIGQPWQTISRQWAAMAQISGQCLTFSRQWAAMAHICPAMAQISRQWAAMAHICPAMAQISRQWAGLAHICSALALIFLGSGLPWLKFLGNGSHFLGNDHPQWADMAQFSRQWLTISRQWPAMAHNCPAMPQISRQWAAMAQFSGHWHTISRQWAAMAQISGQWLTISRQRPAMAHNCPAMPQISRQWAAMAQFSGHWHTISRQWAAMAQISGQWLTISRQWAAMAHSGPAMPQISRQWAAFSHIFSAMAFIFLGNGLPWLKFLGNGSHFLGNDQLWHTFAQPWPNSLGNGRPRLRFVGIGTHFLGNGQPWGSICLSMAHIFSKMGQRWYTFAQQWGCIAKSLAHNRLAMGSHVKKLAHNMTSNGPILSSRWHNCPVMGLHWHVDGTQLHNHGAALARRWHIIAYQWAALASHCHAFAQPWGSIGKFLAHVSPAMGSQVDGTQLPSNGQPSQVVGKL
ncbi:hypothetical protein Acr_26g0007390 [Actinidia rufa]|uniref:Uncharacterized protein n=1 Tax=Actinidia rufa TaxID=165716 RepID=A0A7J0H342_9ERIC|nr:hypothetical protein Acr_26g0007390 [Actinidia rufa]